jgi:hypothetical protein
MYTAEFWWSGGPASGEDGGGETAWQNLLRDNGEFLRRVFTHTEGINTPPDTITPRPLGRCI